jgi:hypothetical protein
LPPCPGSRRSRPFGRRGLTLRCSRADDARYSERGRTATADIL